MSTSPPPQPPVPPVPPVPPSGSMPPVPPPPTGVVAPVTAPGTAAPVPPAAYSYDYAAQPPAATPRRRRTWDLVLSIILLVLGLFGMGLGLLYAALLTDPEFLRLALEPQGYDVSRVDAGIFPAVVAISHIGLYLLSAAITIPLLVRGGVVVFWIPLTAGVIATAVFWIGFLVVILPGIPTAPFPS